MQKEETKKDYIETSIPHTAYPTHIPDLSLILNRKDIRSSNTWGILYGGKKLERMEILRRFRGKKTYRTFAKCIYFILSLNLLINTITFILDFVIFTLKNDPLMSVMYLLFFFKERFRCFQIFSWERLKIIFEISILRREHRLGS